MLEFFDLHKLEPKLKKIQNNHFVDISGVHVYVKYREVYTSMSHSENAVSNEKVMQMLQEELSQQKKILNSIASGVADVKEGVAEIKLSIESSTKLLQKTMMNLSERTHPTTFVLVEDVKETAPEARVRTGFIDRMKALVDTMSDPTPLLREDAYHIFLLCERCSTKQEPPYVVTRPKELITKILPLVKFGYKFVYVANKLSGLGRVFGLPTPVLEDETISRAGEFIEALDRNDLDAYDEMQKQAEERNTDKGSQDNRVDMKAGYCAREFLRFLQENDADSKWGGLSRDLQAEGGVLFVCKECLDPGRL